MSATKDLIREIQSGAYDTAIRNLYADNDATVSAQRERYVNAVKEFEALFGEGRDVVLYSAPGRTEIGGNHTDHNNGVVMAAAVNLDVIAVVSRNDENIARVKSAGFDNMDVVNVTELAPRDSEKGRSAALVRGVAAAIVREGGAVGGFDAFTTSNVLRGSGLSSSAAFEVIIGAIFNGEYNEGRFSAVDIAKMSQYAENVFFDKPCGLMDQTACSVGSAITIDFKDPSNPVVNKVGFDLAKHGFALCITDTKGSHADLTDDYASIRSEMEGVAAYFGKKVLREVDEAELFANIVDVREKLGDRAVLRAIHFFAECRRAQEIYRAISEDRFEDFLKHIINGGHSSFEYNQNAYSIKKPREQGVALGVALSQHVLEGRGAWRLQGGGFAGTIQAFVPYDLLDTYRNTMDTVFGTGSCYVLSVRNYGAIPVAAANK